MENLVILATATGNFFVKLEENVFAYFNQGGKILRFAHEGEWNWASKKLPSGDDVSDVIKKSIWDNFIAKKEEIEKVSFFTESFFALILRYKGMATFTRHEYSNMSAETSGDISDFEIFEVFQKMQNHQDLVKFTISDIRYVEHGNCEGDELYPVKCKMTLLPDKMRYYIEITGYRDRDDFCDEYVYTLR